MANEKKPETLADNLSSSRKYDPNIVQQNQQQAIENLNKLKTKLTNFQKKLVKKFPFTRALAILPPQAALMFEEDENIPKEISDTKPTHILMLIPEEEYKNLAKIKPEVVALAKETGENIWVHIKTSEVDLWNYGLDSKFEFLDAISASFPLYDNGFLGALRMAIIHKNLVLNWLNVGRIRYVATYAIGGSLVRGTADKTSDVDTFVIIDDTDVKRMSRIELLEKLRGKIVNEFVREATVLSGVNNILNVQVYLLTDFWQSVKDAQPVMFTFIRDGVPLYDRGTFIPWKRLLQMGRIKPSPEAIDLYMKEGDRTEEIINRRLIDGMIDVYFGVVTPTQAMMMLSGHAPPVPKVIVDEVRKVLVEQEKVMSAKELKTLERVVKLYKDYEHGKLKNISGKEIDELLVESKEYSKKMKEMREKLEMRMHEHQAQKIHEEVFSLMKKIFNIDGQEALISAFEKEMIKKGKMPERMLAIARDLSKIKAKAKKEKLSQSDMQRLTRDSAELINALTEYTQRKELATLERGIISLTSDGKKARVVMTDHGIFIVGSDNSIKKIGSNSLTESSQKEFESALSQTKEKSPKHLSTAAIDLLRKHYPNLQLEF